MFTGEEALGRFIDLNPLHAQYLNLPFVKRQIGFGAPPVDYLKYLADFDSFPDVPREEKSTL